MFYLVEGERYTNLWKEAEKEVEAAEAASLSSDCKQERILSGQ